MNRVLSKIFGLKREEVKGVGRKLRHEEHNYLYLSLKILLVIKSRKVRLDWHVARFGRLEAYTGFGWKLERKTPLGRPRHK